MEAVLFNHERTNDLKKIIGAQLIGISSMASSILINSNEITLIERARLSFLNAMGLQNIFEFAFRGHDSVSDYSNPSHGIIISEISQENLKNSKFQDHFHLTFDSDFIVTKIIFWSDANVELEFPKICDVITLEFTNNKSIFFRLSDRSDADLILSDITIEQLFEQYIDFENRELILLSQLA